MSRHPRRYRHDLLPAFFWPFAGALAGFLLFAVIFEPAVDWLAAMVIGGILGAFISAHQVFHGPRPYWRHRRG